MANGWGVLAPSNAEPAATWGVVQEKGALSLVMVDADWCFWCKHWKKTERHKLTVPDTALQVVEQKTAKKKYGYSGSLPGWLLVRDGKVAKVLPGGAHTAKYLSSAYHREVRIESWQKRREDDNRPFGIARHPKKRPGPMWKYGGRNLRAHVVRDHGVDEDSVRGLSVRELRIVHSNIHNNYPALGANRSEQCQVG
tara:strand:- start:9536 stop:10123 length:588 start_codon:yes stop_codon:yes gene_type:complete